MATCAFSANGNYLAVSSPDGRLSVWSTVEKSLKQQYIPSAHLSATLTCLAWRHSRKNQEHKKRRRSKKHKGGDSETDQAIEETDLIAMGTIGGSVLIYSMRQGDLKSRLEKGHEDTVNDVCWDRLEDTLYSCGDDGNIVEWDLVHGVPKNKWKGDKGSVHSLAVCPISNALLSAGRMIKLWNLDDQEVLKQFSGHASPVTRLLFTPFNLYPKETEDTASIEGLHFLSAAQNERVINVWQIKSKTKSKTAAASLLLQQEPSFVDISYPDQRKKTIRVAAVTREGCVHVFSLVLNGQAKEPFQPSHTISIATQGDKVVTPRPITIIAAHFARGQQDRLLLAYGSSFKTAFEFVSLETDQKEICLVRDDPSLKKSSQEMSGDKIKRPGTSEDATVLTPYSSAPLKPALATDSETPVRRKRKADKPEVSLEDKLMALSMAQSQADTSKEHPNLNSMVTLLTQALQSQDKNLLEKVLGQNKANVIKRTVHRLPVTLIEPLLHELARRLDKTPESALTTTVWTKTVLREKASFLTSSPELVRMISEIYEKISGRTHAGKKLNMLQGKLDLMLSQVASQKAGSEEEPYSNALLVYEEDSEEENLMESLPAVTSESEVDWEEEDASDGESSASDMDEEDDGIPEDKGSDEESSEESEEEDSDEFEEKK
ncbi:WD repeat-containing protein 43 [Holothuria leucospilota]|uniref:WD repeat-containing protein 43 n=1 Tax=Holothuria leucospilota TaxID=206669 RepID=A0A9Q1CIL2_HOLLE|nr:WD repeat-containing protein 43 [Holothuria leucospilota]